MNTIELKAGDWFSITKIISCPNDGSWRGNLFLADKVEGSFAACRRWESDCGGHRKVCLHLPDYEVQKLTPAFVLFLRPELDGVVNPKSPEIDREPSGDPRITGIGAL